MTSTNLHIGSQFVNKVLRLQSQQKRHFINENTRDIIAALQKDKEHEKHPSPSASAVKLWQHAADVVHKARSQLHYRNHFKIAHTEHMSSVDAFDGEKTRKGQDCAEVSTEENADLLVVAPAIDGRLKNEGADSHL